MGEEKRVYTVEDIKQIMGIGINKAYELVKSGAFPVKQFGRQYFISKTVFDSWLVQDDKENET